MISAGRLILLFHEYVFLRAFVVAERYKTDFAIFVSFRDEVITATIKKEIVIEVVDKWLSRVTFGLIG